MLAAGGEWQVLFQVSYGQCQQDRLFNGGTTIRILADSGRVDGGTWHVDVIEQQRPLQRAEVLQLYKGWLDYKISSEDVSDE